MFRRTLPTAVASPLMFIVTIDWVTQFSRVSPNLVAPAVEPMVGRDEALILGKVMTWFAVPALRLQLGGMKRKVTGEVICSPNWAVHGPGPEPPVQLSW
ncbi:hypothetical protein D3C72_1321190 [compost metagenome]